jgi:hypothetical protein
MRMVIPLSKSITQPVSLLKSRFGSSQRFDNYRELLSYRKAIYKIILFVLKALGKSERELTK